MSEGSRNNPKITTGPGFLTNSGSVLKNWISKPVWKKLETQIREKQSRKLIGKQLMLQKKNRIPAKSHI